MLRVTLAVAAVIAVGRIGHRDTHVHARGHHRPVVPVDSRGIWHRSETVHTEQAQQQSAHEQPTGPQYRLRSKGELYEARHGAIVGTGR